jgi:hypothetical protein
MVFALKTRTPSRASLALAGLFAVGATVAIAPNTFAARGDSWPSQMQARYDVSFNGIGVGGVTFESSNDGQAYSLKSDARLSLLLGAIKWSGNTQAQGRLGAEGPQPQGFQFQYQSTKKTGSTRLGFNGSNVTSVSHEPPSEPKPDIIPVTERHLKGVLDPMSAIMLVGKGTSGDPCNRRIPIYDGKERFDLVLSPRGQVRLTETRASGQPGVGYVCRVKYVPIAGHHPENARALAREDGIELVLRPIPSANVFVPISVTIPTAAGSAKLNVRDVRIITNDREQIALSH